MKFFLGFMTGIIATILFGLLLGGGHPSFENSDASPEEIAALSGVWSPVDGSCNDIEFNEYGAFYDYSGSYKEYKKAVQLGINPYRAELEYQVVGNHIMAGAYLDVKYKITDGYLELTGDGKFAGKYIKIRK